ncbi:MAG TPA: DUF2231 domain-containing protein [Bdellovibrionota bacterium]|nr:DUF2231 domain-containing protein [Bdellovibrionota bacterium]
MFKYLLQGRFMRHPLHPLLVHLPVGLWIGSLIFDIIFLASGNANLAIASYYSMLIGIIAVALAAPTGLADYVTIPANTRPKRLATTHMIMNVGITVLYLINLIVRRSAEGGVPTFVTTGQFIFSIICVVLLGISGYLGGLLVYNYGVGYRKPSETDFGEGRRAA